jgi:predicted nucleic acid-binding protein
MLMVDSSVWIDYFRQGHSRQCEQIDSLLDGNEHTVIVGDLVLHEVLRGFRSDAQFRKALTLLGALPCETLVDEARAIRAAERYRLLRSRGLTVRSTPDCLIASWCIDEGVPLLADDRDFGPFAEHLGLGLLTG